MPITLAVSFLIWISSLVFALLSDSYGFRIGWLFLVGFPGIATFLSVIVRPFLQVYVTAERVSAGDFPVSVPPLVRFETSITRAFKLAFEALNDRLLALIGEVRRRVKSEAEIEIASRVQGTLFPPSQVELRSHLLQSRVRMAESCGGDWWGYVELERADRPPLLYVMIGDVTGHGVGSALVTAAAQGCLTTLKEWLINDSNLMNQPEAIVELFNQVVRKGSGSELHMTFLLARLDPACEEMVLVNAGHNLPFLISPQGKVNRIGTSGPVLGSLARLEALESRQFPWKKGSSLFLYTDGFLEPHNPEHQGVSKRSLQQTLKKSSDCGNPSSWIDSVFALFTDSIGSAPLTDDVSVVLVHHRAD